jgi:lysophospholipase L1-like esterase
LDLSTTIAAQLGDYVGVRVTYSSASAQLFNSETPVNTSSTIYSISNATASDTFYAWESQTATANACVVLESYMTAPVLVAIGDSIMSGNSGSASLIETNGTYVAGIDIPDQLATGTRWSVQNMGYSGNRIVGQILPRFTNDLINSYPRLALLEGGVNDLRDGTSTASILAAYGTMLTNCVTAGIKPILIGIMPFRTLSGATDLMLTNRDTLNPQLRSAVEAVGGTYVDPDPYIGRFYDGGPANNRWALTRDADSGDGIHLSTAGRTLIAKAVLEATAPLTVRGGLVAGSINAGSLTVNGPILLDSTAALQTISAARPTNTAQTAGFLYVQAQSAASTATNAAAGSLVIRSGAATGSGTGYVYVQSATPGSSGTADTAWATRADFSYAGTRIYGDNTSFGSIGAPDSRFGIYYRGLLADSLNSIGVYSLPHISVDSSASIASVTAGMIATTGLTKAVGFYAPEPSISGGSYTAYFPMLVDLSSTPSNGAGLYIGSAIPSGFTGTFAIYSAITNAVSLAGPLVGSSYIDVDGNNHAFGTSATPDARFGLYYRGAMASTVNNVGVYSLPEVSTNSAYAAAFASGVRATGNLGTTIGYYSPLPTEVSANITNHIGVWAQTGTSVADWSAGIFIGDTLPSLQANYALYASSTLPALFAGQVQSLSAFSSTANAHALGAGASVDSRFGLYLRPTISSAVNAYGLYSIPSLSGNPATTGAGVLGSVIVTQPTSGAIGLQAGAPIESGSGVLTNWFGIAIDTTPTADKTVGLYIGRGTPFTAPAAYAIYSVETNASLFSGPLDIGSADTTLARLSAGQLAVEGVQVALKPATETLTYSTTNVTITAGKGPMQRSLLTVTNNFQLLWSGLTDNDGGVVHLIPATTNVTVLVSSPGRAAGSSAATATGSTTLTITGATNGWVEMAWSVVSVGGTNRVSVNLGAY